MSGHAPVITAFKKQSGTDRTLYVRWTAPSLSVEGYKVKFWYWTGDDVWFPESTSDTTDRVAIYTYQENAKKVMVSVGGVYEDGKKTDWADKNVTYDTSTGVNKIAGAINAGAPTDVVVDLQSGQGESGRTLYATWKWTQKQTDHYEVIWQYATGDGVWFSGSNASVNVKNAVYSAQPNATWVRFTVKPVSKTWSNGDKEYPYFTAKRSTAVSYKFQTAPDYTPAKPSTPTVTISGRKITAELITSDVNSKSIQFQVVKNNSKIVHLTIAKVATTRASMVYNGDTNSVYKVRCRGLRTIKETTTSKKTENGLAKIPTKTAKAKNIFGEWSDYSANVTSTPAAPKGGITKHSVISLSSAYIYWNAVSGATGYDIEYTTNKNYFDHGGETQTVSVDSAVGYCVISGLTSAIKYYFRIRTKNSAGTSPWSPTVYQLILGTKPSPPTTWSESETVIAGERIRFFWVHNAEDGSSQSAAQFAYTVNGETTIVDRGASETTGVYSIQTSAFTEGYTLYWRVRTKGVHADWSGWSVRRAVTVCGRPSLELGLQQNGNDLEEYEITAFPFSIDALAIPPAQSVLGWTITIVSVSDYDIVDYDGTIKHVGEGEEIFSEHILSDGTNSLLRTFSAGDVNLENNAEYELTCTAGLDSGLTASQSIMFSVSWDEGDDFIPNAEIAVDMDTLTAYIRPYCASNVDVPEGDFEPVITQDDVLDASSGTITDSNGNSIVSESYDLLPDDVITEDDDEYGTDIMMEGVVLSVYRREYDGRFVELASDLENTKLITITDPHPALNYARYRIVAMSTETGRICFNDLPGFPVGEPSIVLQWDETWTDFNLANGTPDEYEERPWSGSMLKLPYNIGVSDSMDPDIKLVEYIGRSHPVGYYGTQLGYSSTWTAEIDKKDEETLYAIRRLAAYLGDVYVREPSGTGYWAQVTVSYNRKYDSVKIPISLHVTRVEGGV